MTENFSADDAMDGGRSPTRPVPDAHGQAALLFAESILHALVENRVLTLDQATETVRTACEVKIDVAEETGEPGETMRHSLRLLSKIERSLEADRGNGHGAA